MHYLLAKQNITYVTHLNYNSITITLYKTTLYTLSMKSFEEKRARNQRILKTSETASKGGEKAINLEHLA